MCCFHYVDLEDGLEWETGKGNFTLYDWHHRKWKPVRQHSSFLMLNALQEMETVMVYNVQSS